MTTNRSVAIRTWALSCASAVALLALAACEQPRAPEPLPPPSPEQMDSDMRAPDPGPPPESDMDEAPKPPEDMDNGGQDMDIPPAPPEPPYEPRRSRGPIAMEPIPNPPGADEYGRRWGRGRGPRSERPMPPRPSEEPKPPEIADAAGAPPPPPQADMMRPGEMAPIPNPPEGRRDRGVPRGDSGLMGAPPPVRVMPRPPMAAAPMPPPPPMQAGPMARAPIAPAMPARPAQGRAMPQASSSMSSATGSNATTAVADAAGSASASGPRTLDQAAETLRSRVESDARLETPATWTTGQTGEVRLRFPEGFAQEVANATAGQPGGSSPPELSATLTGDGFRIEPSGPQSISSEAAASGIVWRVTPERADPGPLRATVEASAPVAGGRRVLPLGEVGDRAGGGGFQFTPMMGWILGLLALAAFVVWVATRRPRDSGDTDEDRRRRRRRNEQNAAPRGAPFDFRPEDPDSPEARAARVEELRAEEERRQAAAAEAARAEETRDRL